AGRALAPVARRLHVSNGERTARRALPRDHHRRQARAHRLRRVQRPRALVAVKKPPGRIFARVHALVREIPRGRVATYGQLARLIGRGLTPVGIGWALGAVGDDVPWQRVINSKGGISTDNRHPGLQKRLLKKEGVRFNREGFVDLSRYQYRWPQET